LVTATCEPLELHVERGSFRGDLYQRLSQCVVRVPPLRERLSDLPSLLSHMLAEPPLEGFSASPCALAALMAHDFPGNVRELKNLLSQAALTAEERVIDRRVIDLVLAQRRGLRGRRALSPADAVALLAQNEGNVSAAARHARLPRTTFRDLLRRARAEAR
jgi:DNA-binding NtrC family response regulator